jgi:transposase
MFNFHRENLHKNPQSTLFTQKTNSEEFCNRTKKKTIQSIKTYVKKYNCYRSQDVKSGLKLPYSLRYVQKLVVSAKLRLRCPKTKPTLSEKTIQSRFEWAKSQLAPIIDISKIICDDEAGFSLRAPSHYRRILLSRDEKRIDCHLPDFHQMLWVWGAVGYGFKSQIVPLSGKVTGEVYRSILEKNLISPLEEAKCYDKFLLTDNAPWHTAKLVKSYLEQCPISLVPLPPHSPDLNVIENIWSLMKQKVYGGGKSYDSIPQLRTAVIRAWEAIPQSKIDEYMESVGRRMISVVVAQGGSTTY